MGRVVKSKETATTFQIQNIPDYGLHSRWSVLIHILKYNFIILHLYGKTEHSVFYLPINKFLADICAVFWFYSDKNDLSFFLGYHLPPSLKPKIWYVFKLFDHLASSFCIPAFFKCSHLFLLHISGHKFGLWRDVSDFWTTSPSICSP